MIWKETLITLAVTATIATISLLVIFNLPGNSEQDKEFQREIYRIEGYNAYHDGIPANANPYIGRHHNATLWLEGWTQGKRGIQK
jgi:hypothetical protein